MLSTFIEEHALPDKFAATALHYYQPLAEEIYRQCKDNPSPFFVGINGSQGSGKSTLTDYLSLYLESRYRKKVVVISLDDFYLDSNKRNQLANSIHPLLSTRGVPGTHDTFCLKQTLSKLSKGEVGFSIPTFNKATDEPNPEEKWQKIDQPIDIILLEGWCWGVEPQTTEQLETPINELELKQDEKGIWRKFVNQQLTQYYLPLYEIMDYWLVLQAPSFDCVYQWRLEQEEKLAARNAHLTNSRIMTADQILAFTQYFQRLSVHGCRTTHERADTIFYLDYDRSITQVVMDEKACVS
jgi:D-glycerate 3-kinase